MEPIQVIRFRRRKRARSMANVQGRLGTLGAGLLLLFGAAFGVGLVALGALYMNVTRDLPPLEALPALFDGGKGPWMQPLRVYDRTGTRLILSLENPGAPRRYLPIDPAQPDALPGSLITLTLRAKDPTFASHAGYSLYGLLDGAHPTLAQILVSDTLLENEPPSLRRNLRERLLAAELTARYGRTQILEWYLNSVDYGHYAVGAEAAAQAFFGKPAHDLNLGEAAILVAVADAPALNPIDAPGAALQLRHYLLERLVAQKALTANELQQILSAQLQFQPAPADASLAPAFTRLALARLQDLVGADRMVHGGLTVTTTLDLDLQQQVLCTLRTHLLRLEGNPYDIPAADGSACQAASLLPVLAPEARDLPQGISAAAEVLDPQTGEVLALTGETGLDSQSTSLVEKAPGSILTPFIYLAGFARGYGPASLVWDLPSSVPTGQPGLENPDGVFHGPLRMRTALVNDAWVPAAWLLDILSPNAVWRQARLLGLASAEADGQAPGYPFAGGRVGLLELSQAYGVLANQGNLAGAPGKEGAVSSNLILKVQSAAGDVLVDRTRPASLAVVSAPLAYQLNSVLSDEPARRTGNGNTNPLEIGRPAGARLGRTQDGAAWTVGYTPRRVVSVWLGKPAGSAWTGSLDPGLAAGLWHALTRWSTRGDPPEGWTQPPGVSVIKVCDPSGLLPTPQCPSVVDEVFLSGNEPTHADTIYRSFQVNRETGRLATVFTPPQTVEEKVYPVYPADALDWARQEGLPLPPESYDDILPQPALAGAAIQAPGMFAVVRGKVDLRGTARADDFASYRVQVGAGLNPTEWLQLGEGTFPVTDGILASWDTAGKAGLYAVRLMVVHRDQRVETATIQVTVDNDPPSAAVAYPKPDETFHYPTEKIISLQGAVEDAVGIDRVEWWVDGKLAKVVTQAPFSLPWTAAGPGEHQAVVKAYDRAGNSAESAPVKFSFGP